MYLFREMTMKNSFLDFRDFFRMLIGGKMKTLARSFEVFSALLLLPLISAAAPLLVNYQGRLVDTTGNPLIGSQTVLFSVYDAPSSGSLLWSETQTVTPDNGIFSVSLGSVTPLPASVFSSDSRYLEVKLGSDAPMAPRTRLLSTPYALYTANLGSSGTQALISTDTVVSASQLRLGNFTTATMPAGIGAGAMVYNAQNTTVYYFNGSNWIQMGSGGVSPWSDDGGGSIIMVNPSNIINVSNTAAGSITTAGGIKAGTPAVSIIGANGKIPALTSGYLSNLNGSALTGLTASQVDLSTVTAAISSGLSPVQAAISTAVYNTGSYSDPSWITGLAASKLIGVIPGSKVDLSTVTAAISPIQAAISTAVYTTQSYANPLWLTSLTASKLTGAIPGSEVDLSTVTAAISSGLSPVQAAISTAVYTTQSYANPLWLTSLAASKLTGAIPGSEVDLSTVTAAISSGLSPVQAAISTAVYNTGSYPNPAWITSLAASKLTGAIPGSAVDLSTVTAAISPIQAAISTAVYNTGLYSNPSWITGLAASKLTGAIPGSEVDLSTVTAAISSGLSPVQAAISTAVYTTQIYSNPSWITNLALSRITGVAASTDTVPMARIAGALSSTTTVPAGLVNLSTVAALGGANTFTSSQTITAADGLAEVRGGLTVGSGSKVNKIISGTFTIDPANVPTLSCVDTSVTLAAAADGDKVMWTAPGTIESGIMWSSYNAGAGSLGLRICNFTGGDINPVSADWGYLIVR
jgi:hypothetical protein